MPKEQQYRLLYFRNPDIGSWLLVPL